MSLLRNTSNHASYLMALDAGTGSIRAVIFSLEGQQIAVGQAEWQHNPLSDVPG
ncbi:autoinducer-2 (AI-2) kinase, partial [Serratia sp. M24T3]